MLSCSLLAADSLDRRAGEFSMKTLLLRSALVLLAIYAVLVAGLAWAMRQPPDVFGRVMSKAPLAAFIFLPFETLWSSARAGSLRVGDPAPNFALQTLDKNSTVELAAFKAKRPVVLIFGSYT